MYQDIDPEIDREAQAARKLIAAILDDPTTPSDNVALARLDDRIDPAVNDLRRRMNEQDADPARSNSRRGDFDRAKQRSPVPTNYAGNSIARSTAFAAIC